MTRSFEIEYQVTALGQVFYRKWRPRRLDQVVGQGHVTQTLRQAVAQGRVAHAYLFCGPRGTGKTSTARILAKAVNCAAPVDGEPDDTCDMCLAVNEGRALDLIEVDAASNRRIDDIRDLRERVHYAPTEARYKVYIVDEVHMLTPAAFNALLKTLEEPPPHVIFVLATTEAHEVPPTIISRCQRFDFRRIPLEGAVKRLEELCVQEGMAPSRAALAVIARASAGSLRDAENLLEQALVSCGPGFTEAQVRDLLELGREETALELAGHFVAGRVREGLLAIGRAAEDGVDMRRLHKGVQEHLRAVFLAKMDNARDLGYSAEMTEVVTSLAGATTMAHLVRTLKAVVECDLRRDPFSPLPLELALVESSMAGPAVALAVAAAPPDEAQAPRAPRRAPASAAPSTPAASAPPPRAQGRPPASAPAAPPPVRSEPTAAPEAPALVSPGPEEPSQRLERQWRSVIRSLDKRKGKRWTLGALLRNCKAREVGDGVVTLKFTHRSYMEKMAEEMEDAATRRLIVDALATALGGPYDVRVAVADGDNNASAHGASHRSHLVRAAQAMGLRVVEEKEQTREQEHAAPGPGAPEADGETPGGA